VCNDSFADADGHDRAVSFVLITAADALTRPAHASRTVRESRTRRIEKRSLVWAPVNE
jgi:hypothetical protein